MDVGVSEVPPKRSSLRAVERCQPVAPELVGTYAITIVGWVTGGWRWIRLCLVGWLVAGRDVGSINAT